jgi:hypothetical protein
MYRVYDLLDLLRVTKTNNLSLSLHVTSFQKMIHRLFSYDHHNSARYSAIYLKTMLNLPTTHPGSETLLPEKGFIMNMSSVPGSRYTIEQNLMINKHARSQG